MADSGFYYTPTQARQDRVTCFWCKTKEHGLDNVDSISEFHHENNPRCAFSLISMWLERFVKGSNKSTFWQGIGSKAGPIVSNPLSEESILLRIATFKDLWKFDNFHTHTRVTSRDLAEAGFYYSPVDIGDDRVICMYCDCPLSEWDSQDDPLKEHRKNSFEYCYFLEQITNPLDSERKTLKMDVRKTIKSPDVSKSRDKTESPETSEVHRKQDDAFDFSIEELQNHEQGTIFEGKDLLPKKFQRKKQQKLQRPANHLETIAKVPKPSQPTPIRSINKSRTVQEEIERALQGISSSEEDYDVAHKSIGNDGDVDVDTRIERLQEGEDSDSDGGDFGHAAETSNENPSEYLSESVDAPESDSTFSMIESSSSVPEKRHSTIVSSTHPTTKKQKPSVARRVSQFDDDDFGLNEKDIERILNSPKKARKVKVIPKKETHSPSVSIYDDSNQNLGDYEEGNLSFLEKKVKPQQLLHTKAEKIRLSSEDPGVSKPSELTGTSMVIIKKSHPFRPLSQTHVHDEFFEVDKILDSSSSMTAVEPDVEGKSPLRATSRKTDVGKNEPKIELGNDDEPETEFEPEPEPHPQAEPEPDLNPLDEKPSSPIMSIEKQAANLNNLDVHHGTNEYGTEVDTVPNATPNPSDNLAASGVEDTNTIENGAKVALIESYRGEIINPSPQRFQSTDQIEESLGTVESKLKKEDVASDSIILENSPLKLSKPHSFSAKFKSMMIESVHPKVVTSDQVPHALKASDNEFESQILPHSATPKLATTTNIVEDDRAFTLSPSSYKEYQQDLEEMDIEFVDASVLPESRHITQLEDSEKLALGAGTETHTKETSIEIKDDSFVVQDSASELVPVRADSISPQAKNGVKAANGYLKVEPKKALRTPSIDTDVVTEKPKPPNESQRVGVIPVGSILGRDNEKDTETEPEPEQEHKRRSDLRSSSVSGSELAQEKSPSPPSNTRPKLVERKREEAASEVSLIALSFDNVDASTPRKNDVLSTRKADSDVVATFPHVSLQFAYAQVKSLEEAIERMSELSTTKFELHNDADGYLTEFIAAMPEKEESMTIQDWILENSAACERTIGCICERIVGDYLEEFEKLITHIDNLSTVD